MFILCGAGMQRRDGQLTETLRAARLGFQVMETVRGASPVGGRPELHLRCWKRVLADDLPGAILLEDGASLMPGFTDFLEAGGYFHADVTQFCHGRGRIWGGAEGSDHIRLRPLAFSTGLPSGYALSRRAAKRLTEAALAQAETRPVNSVNRALAADWPCDVTRLGALVCTTELVTPPAWLADAAPAGSAGWREFAAAALPLAAANRLRGIARSGFAGEANPQH